jgi:chemotaxis protein methyltransferase CheR
VSERLFTITGVDIDSSAIAAAGNGVYGKGSFRSMDPGVRERYFDPSGPGAFRIRESIRKLVGFEVVNLLGPFYPQGMHLPDIIFYRNVSIYFPQEVQRTIFAKLAGLLNEGGYLMVGAAETIHHDIGVLSLINRDDLFFYRKTPAPVFEERRGARRHESISVSPGPAAAVAPAALSVAPRHVRRPEARPPERPRQGPDCASPVRDVKALFDAALALACNGGTDEALGILDTIIERDASFTKACTLKGSLLLSAARFDEATALCYGILSRDPLCLEAYLMLGVIARHRGNNEAGFQRFREAIYLDPACWLAHFYTAEILFVQGEAKRARSGYEAASRILEKGAPRPHGQAFFPLSFNAEQFIVICRHKLSLLKEIG